LKEICLPGFFDLHYLDDCQNEVKKIYHPLVGEIYATKIKYSLMHDMHIVQVAEIKADYEAHKR
jgi:hypothetical protein